MSRSHNPSRASTTGLGWPDFARRYFRDRGCFLFLRVLRCFSSPGLPRACARSSTLRPMGLPHSEILGSQLVCSSPRLIAAYHVLHRLPVPRHPPCALTRLISVSRCDSSTPQHTHSSVVKERKKRRWSSMESAGDKFRGLSLPALTDGAYSALQKGGDPAAGSPTATLLRLRPSHRIDLRRLPPCGWPTGFGSLRLPWRDGRCVQGPGTYSPRRG